MLAIIVAVSLWTPFIEPEIADRWFSFPELIFLSPIPIITAVVGLMLLLALKHQKEYSPFVYAIGLFMLSYLGLAISMWPYIVPRDITIWEAAAPEKTQIFLLVGVSIFLPLIIGYTIYLYRIFGGKVKTGDGYH